MASRAPQDFNAISSKWHIKRSNLKYNEETDKLGAGNFCDVYKAKYVSSSGQASVVAVKVNYKENEENHDEAQEARKSMLHEARLMSNFCHPNVIGFSGVVCDDLPTWLVMEYCPGGSLFDHLCKYPEIPQLELMLYCFEVTQGMRYLHRQKCIHRDLATRNCLISAKGLIKIADFGLSKIVDDVQQNNIEAKVKHIPIRWMAPECVTRPPTFSFASDIWSFGVLIYEVFNKGVSLWPGDTDYKAMGKRIRTIDMPKFPDSTPELIVKLVEDRMWVKSPDSRANFKEITIVLSKHLFDRKSQFPPPEKLYINKIKGVIRTQDLQLTKEALNDESSHKSVKSPAGRSSRVSRASQKRYKNRKNLSGRNKKHIEIVQSMADLSKLAAATSVKPSTTGTTTSAESLQQQRSRSPQRRNKHAADKPPSTGFGN